MSKTVVSDFANRIATTMKDIGSSHVYFVIQQAYPERELSWTEAVEIFDEVISNSTSLLEDDYPTPKGE